jgi:hypothetical protein
MYLPLPYPSPSLKEGQMQKQPLVITESKVIEVFEALVEHTDTTLFDKKIEKVEAVLAEKHTVPSEYEVLHTSQRAKVEFNK